MVNSVWRRWAIRFLVFCGLGLSGLYAHGASFTISQTAVPNPASVGSNLLYVITVINILPQTLGSVTVTDALPANVTFVGATNDAAGGVAFTSGNFVVFPQNQMVEGASRTMAVLVRPQSAGTIVNTVLAAPAGLPPDTDTFAVTVGGGAPSVADLSVAITGANPSLITGDLFNYTLIASNSGPASASGITITNTLSVPVVLRSVTPASAGTNFTAGRTLVLNVGTLASGAASTFQVSLQPTNTGSLTTSATIGSSDTTDPNSTNNSASFTTTISEGQGDLIATIESGQVFNFQTGLMDQTIRVLNATNVTMAAVRLVLSNFNHRVYNAVGTNGTSPFVEFAGSLAPSNSVDLVLEYFIPSRTPVNDPVPIAIGIPAINLSAPSNAPPNALIKLTLDDQIMIEFPSEVGATYTIVYADNPAFVGALTAQPPVTAVANRTQWIDEGPPKTISPPADVDSRFYRVIKQ